MYHDISTDDGLYKSTFTSLGSRTSNFSLQDVPDPEAMRQQLWHIAESWADFTGDGRQQLLG